MRNKCSVIFPGLLLSALLALGCDDLGGGSIVPDQDPDRDGLSNAEEEFLGTDKHVYDTDGDGLGDGTEVGLHTDPLDPDSDHDGLDDGAEIEAGTDPLDPDTDDGGTNDGTEVSEGRDPRNQADDFDLDRDGLRDDEENELGTDPADPDSDDDGLTDFDEVRLYGSDPGSTDSDGDGVDDLREIQEGSSPTSEDTDEDGIPDGVEIDDYGTDPADPDTDNDGLTDLDEVEVYGTDPTDADTDDDGLTDGRDVFAVGSDPNQADSDGDGLTDPEEFEAGTNPMRADTDGDGLTDPAEVRVHSTSPILSDTDSDGLPDGVEVAALGALEPFGATNPNQPDSDGDGLQDGDEIFRGANPLVPDTDGDGLPDGQEVFEQATDPSFADTDEDGLEDGDELAHGVNPLLRDTDRDGLDDGVEVHGIEVVLPDGTSVRYTSNPALPDTDGDGFNDAQEALQHGTDPSMADTDGDGLTDVEEILNRLDPFDDSDGGAIDTDEDGLTNRQELDRGLDLHRADTDFDRLSDGDEVTLGTNPLSTDSDEDGLIDGDEVEANIDPLAEDTDLDGLLDGEEQYALIDGDEDGLVGAVDPDSDNDGLLDSDEVLIHRTDEGSKDTDGDNIPDGAELDWGLDPLDPGDSEGDPDGDGLTNLEEFRYGTDMHRVDSDGDGVPDGIELAVGLNPDDPDDGIGDFDGDGIANRNEVCPEGASEASCLGETTSLRSADSDLDGLPDSMDTEPNDWDRDGDGINDGDEVFIHLSNVDSGDSDGDGLSDADELVVGGDLWRSDADGDGLSDSQEAKFGTDPTLADSDGDGLSDFEETIRGFFVPVYGFDDPLQVFTDPLSVDTDADNINDAVEVAALTSPLLADTDGDGLDDGVERDLRTDPFDQDSDDDGIEDGVDPAPLDRDADQDGIPDVAELVDGYNGLVLSVGPTLPQTIALDVTRLRREWFRLAVLAGPASPDPTLRGGEPVVDLTVQAQDMDPIESTHALRWQGDRYLYTAPFRTAAGTIEVRVEQDSGADAVVREMILQAIPDIPGGVPIVPLLTLAEWPDSDGDRLGDGIEAGSGFWTDSDGDGRDDTYNRGFFSDIDRDGVQESGESSRGFWLEAEHYADPSLTRVMEPEAGNGIVVQEERMKIVFGSGGGNWGYVPGVRYAVFLRGRILFDNPAAIDIPGCENEACPNLIWVTVDRGDPPVDDCSPDRSICAIRLTMTNHLEWRYAGTYTPGDRFEITVADLLVDDLWVLDRVAIIPIDFLPAIGVEVDATSILPDRRVEGVNSGVLVLDVEHPWSMTDPMEADTDGDGYRSVPALCDLDPETCPSGEIPDSIGWLTDGQETFVTRTNPLDIDSDHDADLYPPIEETWPGDGVLDRFAAEIDPRYTDARDPYPVGTDRDLDGLDNDLELEVWEACQAGYQGELACPDPRATGMTCQIGPPGVGQVRCWWTDDDRDNDGLIDGFEDSNQNGRVDQGELDPNAADTDMDGITDGVELGLVQALSFNYQGDVLWPPFAGDTQWSTTTDPFSADTDADGLEDGEEDLDADGSYILDDCSTTDLHPSCGDRTVDHPQTAEILIYSTPQRAMCETNPTASDTDYDGLDDFVEIFELCTSPLRTDSDGDGIDDRVEVRQLLTNPNETDTDGDGLLDSEEVDLDNDILVADPLRPDTDDDGLDDYEEVHGAMPSNPRLADTDGDGLDDYEEVYGVAPWPPTNPALADTDGDTLSDFFEIFGEDLNRNGLLDEGEDQNGDGLLSVPHTDPTDPDTDGDVFRDGEEWRGGSDPISVSSTPNFLDDAGGLELSLAPGNYVVHTDEDGNPTGIITITGSEIPLSCPGRMVTAYGNGVVTIDRTDPEGGQQVSLDGTFAARLPDDGKRNLWSGQTTFIGFDPETGLPSNSSVAFPAEDVEVEKVNFGGDIPVEIEADEAFFDICNGEYGGEGTWSLVGDIGFEAEGHFAVRPFTSLFHTQGEFGFVTPIGPLFMFDGMLDINLASFFAEGYGRLRLPPLLADNVKLFPGASEVDAGVAGCAACLYFVIDPLNGRFVFRPRAEMVLKFGTVQRDPSLNLGPLPEFEIDGKRWLIYFKATLSATPTDEAPYKITGEFLLDMAGQAEFSPRVPFPEPVGCTTARDCRLGQDCITNPDCPSGSTGCPARICQGCAERFRPVLLDRWDIEFLDEGETGDLFSVVLDGVQFDCPGGGSDCAESERINVVPFRETFNFVQTGLMNTRDMARLLVDAIKRRSINQCRQICTREWSQCARASCPGDCRWSTTSDDCFACADEDCMPGLDACSMGCMIGMPVEAYVDDISVIPSVTIEADELDVDFTVTTSVNGVHNDDILAESLATDANGQIFVQATVDVQTSVPTFRHRYRGAVLTDFFDVAHDGDPVTIGINGQYSINSYLGLDLNIGSMTAQVAFDEDDHLSFVTIAGQGGMLLNDLAGGALPGALGNLGAEDVSLLGYSVADETLCGELTYNYMGFSIPLDFQIDSEALVATFAFLLPLGLGGVEGLAHIGWDGDIYFRGELVDKQILSMLVNPFFELNNDGGSLWGELVLPERLGMLYAFGSLDADGQFDLALEGSIRVAGFDITNVTGRYSNSGITVAGRLALPANLAAVDVSGWIRDDGDFHLSGSTTITLPGGTQLRGVQVALDNEGVTLSADLAIPGITSLPVTGRIFSDGYIYLSGPGSIGIGNGLNVGPMNLEFERSTGGVYSISGSGSITVAGKHISDVQFTIGTDGSFSGTGTIDMWVSDATVTIARAPSGSPSMSASVSASVSALGHTLSGSVSLSFSSGSLSFRLSASISGPILNASISVSVSSDGCFSVGGVGRFCL